MLMYDHKVELPPDSRTNDKHIFTIVEVLSGYTWAFPCQTLTSSELVVTLKTFYKTLVVLPKKVFLDNGSNFISEEHHQLLNSLNIQIIHGTPGHSRARGNLFNFLINFIRANIFQRFGGAKTQMYNRTINEILPKRPRSRMGKIFGKSY